MDVLHSSSYGSKLQTRGQREHTPSSPLTRPSPGPQEALATVGIVESDKEVLDRLFTMFDRTGDDQVFFKDFICGVAPLVSGDVRVRRDNTTSSCLCLSSPAVSPLLFGNKETHETSQCMRSRAL